MGFIRKICSVFHDDWCSKCQSKMDERKRQLYMLPMTVGHYVSHSNLDYYKQNLIKVNYKADIPTGTYACGIIVYECPKCNHRAVKLSIFLPVRDEEKYEDGMYLENGEMDDFIWK
jgi:hypothetical protein